MNTSEMEEYKEFLAFKAMKAAVAAAPAPEAAVAAAPAPDMTGLVGARARMAVLMGGAGAAPARPPVRTVNWDKALMCCLQFIFNLRAGPTCTHKNTDWWLWRQLYMENPDKFFLIGTLHTDPTTHETYISARYDFGTGAYATFHIYGTTEGFRFKATRANWAENGKPALSRALWGLKEPYLDASTESGSVRSE